jgi:hypothetical protein
MVKTHNGGAVAVSAKRLRWLDLMKQWERSGQTQQAFCSERGLTLTTFQWWRRQLRPHKVKSAPAASFLPIPVTEPIGGSAQALIEVELGSGTRLRFSGDAALRAVAALSGRIR